MSPPEPAVKRAVAFIDGQNLFHAAREAFGYTYPSYDVQRLAERLCGPRGGDSPRPVSTPGSRTWPTTRSGIRSGRGSSGSSAGRESTSTAGRYATGTRRYACLTGPNTPGEEKGIDVRIALDVIRMAHRDEYDVALLFSQDQDLSEVAAEIRVIAREQNRWIKIACAFPSSPTSRNRRGIDRTDWIPIDRATYDACLDRRDYRRPDTSGS